MNIIETYMNSITVFPTREMTTSLLVPSVLNREVSLYFNSTVKPLYSGQSE